MRKSQVEGLRLHGFGGFAHVAPCNAVKEQLATGSEAGEETTEMSETAGSQGVGVDSPSEWTDVHDISASMSRLSLAEPLPPDGSERENDPGAALDGTGGVPPKRPRLS